ncbi:acid phosphatase [Corynebacterium sp. 335C]
MSPSSRLRRAGRTAAAIAIAAGLPLAAAPAVSAVPSIPGVPALPGSDRLPSSDEAPSPDDITDNLPGSDDIPGGEDLPNLPGGSSENPGLPPVLPAPPTNQPEGAPVPAPFGPEAIARPYRSDNSADGMFYFSVVDPFTDLRRNHPEILDQNLEKTIEINNSVADDREAQLAALSDDHDDLMINLAEALGPELHAHFTTAVEEGRLPKTSQLLSGTLARGGGIASSTFVEKYYYGYDRPFVVAPDRVNRYYRDAEGDDDPYSTTPSYPSGHTNKAYWTAGLLGLMVPEAAPQIQARASEVGYSRLVMGVHYPLDVMGGRMSGTAAAADRWADPEFRPLIEAAAQELHAELEWRCGATIAECMARDAGVQSSADAVAEAAPRMTYGFPRIGEAGAPVVVPDRIAGLLETRFPQLNDEQRKQVLAATAIDSGYPLDRPDGPSHQRLDLARALAAQVTVNADGSVTVVG